MHSGYSILQEDTSTGDMLSQAKWYSLCQLINELLIKNQILRTRLQRYDSSVSLTTQSY
ncbi:hypothetical protein HDF14_003503 [Edaphobacter lichenicola]|jgi:hypothetical protein|uniref:Uncharacterized protein n=1 Tax=Tunturiibacter gelidiferens TaxID=3069689 RepID=A0A9X0U4X2_9BACT|nr:hypothetical protein [Edaphobacter lichenicola]